MLQNLNISYHNRIISDIEYTQFHNLLFFSGEAIAVTPANTCQTLLIIEQGIRIKIVKTDSKTRPLEIMISDKDPRPRLLNPRVDLRDIPVTQTSQPQRSTPSTKDPHLITTPVPRPEAMCLHPYPNLTDLHRFCLTKDDMDHAL